MPKFWRIYAAGYALGAWLTFTWVSAAPDATPYCPKWNIEHGICGTMDATTAALFLAPVWPTYWAHHYVAQFRKGAQ